MRSVSDHLTAVLAAARPVAPLDVVLADSAGCILAEDVTAPFDVPSWTVAGCDGYAVLAADVGLPGPGRAPDVRLPVVHDAPVTSVGPLRLVPGTAILVAAGAPLPHGADAVVPMERTDRGRARVLLHGGAHLLAKGMHLVGAGGAGGGYGTFKGALQTGGAGVGCGGVAHMAVDQYLAHHTFVACGFILFRLVVAHFALGRGFAVVPQSGPFAGITRLAQRELGVRKQGGHRHHAEE